MIERINKTLQAAVLFYVVIMSASCANTALVTADDSYAGSKSGRLLLVLTQTDEHGPDAGILSLSDSVIPEFFTYIEDSSSAYSCYDTEKDSHLSYYRKIPQKKIKTNSDRLTRTDIVRGYYLGSERKADALPSEWIYAEWEGGNAFFEINGFADTINKEPFTSIFRKK